MILNNESKGSSNVSHFGIVGLRYVLLYLCGQERLQRWFRNAILFPIWIEESSVQY